METNRRENGYLEIELESYEEAKETMRILDESVIPQMAEYKEVLKLHPKKIEIERVEGSLPQYSIHFVPLDSAAQKMLNQEGIQVNDALEGKTEFSRVRQIEGELA